jgi:peptide/nickel transport system permease protein
MTAPLTVDAVPEAVAVGVTPAVTRGVAARRSLLRRLLRRPGLVVSVVVIVFWILAAIFGERLAPYSASDQSSAPFLGLSGDHWFGTDGFGRDVFSRVLVGSRQVLLVAPAATLIAVVFGTLIGLVSGYRRGWIDELIMRAFDAYAAIPYLMLVVLVVGIFGRSTWLLVGLIGVSYTPLIARQVRAGAIVQRERQYIEAARLRGEGSLYIMTREILPNVVPIILVEGTMRLGYSVFTAASLSFLGLGAASGSPEWGAVIAENRQNMQFAWWTVLFPALAIITFVVAVTLVADNVREVAEG